jgi:predicted O-methyltransferase YrrM
MLDNTLWMGKVADPNLRAADLDTRIIYETVTNALTNPRFDMHTLCIADGLTIIQVR